MHNIPMRDLTAYLQDQLDHAIRRVGQVLISPMKEGWELRHVEDAGRAGLASHSTPEAARHLANLDDAGAFRPLKTAPTLAHGWRLVLQDAAALRLALDGFYPAMLGVGESFGRGALCSVPLRETLGRQTGMYRVTQKISDAEARRTIDGFCAGCLKQRLWEIDGPNPQPVRLAAGELPLICQEACNLLVAEARKVVKAAEKAQA
jgi:sirohydrochlorin cobaltochelatase